MNDARADAWDVVVAGGGVAGVSVAAALQEFGHRVLLVEPGLDSAKRLAGELIHPPGASDLAELGLLAPLEKAGVAPVLGFAVSPEAAAAPYLLPYGELPGVRRLGFAIDHAVLCAILLEVAARLPHVTLWRDARVTALLSSGRFLIGSNRFHRGITIRSVEFKRRRRKNLWRNPHPRVLWMRSLVKQVGDVDRNSAVRKGKEILFADVIRARARRFPHEDDVGVTLQEGGSILGSGECSTSNNDKEFTRSINLVITD